MSARRVLVLGGSGLVGAAVCRALQAIPFPQFVPVVVDRREPLQRVDWVDYEVGEEVNVFDRDYMTALVARHNPIAVIDCVNVASVTSRGSDIIDAVGKYVFGVVQKLVSKGIVWVDVGTVGTGGMGVNIPYTHNEATADGNIAAGLVRKIAAASIHGGLLDVLGRTPNFRVGRVVPRAMIGFEPPKFGPISVAHLGGNSTQVTGSFVRIEDPMDVSFQVTGPYNGVGCRTGENGDFALEELIAITAIGQMECVTGDAVAAATVDVLMRLIASAGSYIHRDVHPDLTSHTVRNRVVKTMAALCETHQTPSVSFGNLGPFLGCDLWELWTLARLGTTPRMLAENSEQLQSFAVAQHGAIAVQLAALLPGLGIPVITDSLFCPARLDDDNALTVDQIRDQIRRVDLPKNDSRHLWVVDLRNTRLVGHWSDAARTIAEVQVARSHMPLSIDKPVRPGSFWAAYMSATGHGRADYAPGSLC